MKYMNMKKRHWSMNLQIFAGGGDEGDDGGDEGEEPGDEEEDGEEEDPEEKKFSQKELDDAIKKRLAREKRKWQRTQQKKEGEGNNGGTGAGTAVKTPETDEAGKAAEAKVSKLEMKVACFEAGVDKESVDDVTALAKAYMAADEDLDLEEAIEKVVKKYPQFKKGSSDEGDDGEGGTKKKSWGQRQNGRVTKKADGVEAAFLKKNPGLKV